jgi:hypothetical protein
MTSLGNPPRAAPANADGRWCAGQVARIGTRSPPNAGVPTISPGFHLEPSSGQTDSAAGGARASRVMAGDDRPPTTSFSCTRQKAAHVKSRGWPAGACPRALDPWAGHDTGNRSDPQGVSIMRLVLVLRSDFIAPPSARHRPPAPARSCRMTHRTRGTQPARRVPADRPIGPSVRAKRSTH